LTARRLFFFVACSIALVSGFSLASDAQPYPPPWAGMEQGGYGPDGYGPGGYGPRGYGPGGYGQGGYGQGGFRRGGFRSRGAESSNAQRLSMQVAGQQRTYILIRPRTRRPMPTIVFMHGKGSSAERMRFTGFGRLGQRDGFVTVFPNAIGGVWNIFPPGGPHLIGKRGDDTDFIQELVTSLVARGIADPNRIYISGVSFGGFMALRMVCVAPHLFAAVGVALASMPSADGVQCHPPKPMPLVMIAGTADTTVPYAGGETHAGFGIWGTDRTIAFFRHLNGCSEEAERSEMPLAEMRETLPVVVRRWNHCTGAPVMLYSVIGGGHRAPHSMEPGAKGFTNTAAAMWDFFRGKSTRIN
jgi:polyhydroxybutyrate depolymerase